jgi:tetratricopeptide (TPR) repeat protein
MPAGQYWILPFLIAMAAVLGACVLSGAAAQGRQSGSAATNGIGDEVFKKIDVLIGSRQYEAADGVLEHSLTPDVDAAGAYYRMGSLYFSHEQWQPAARFLQKSLQGRNQSDQAHFLLGLAWRELKEPERAESELLTAAALNPGSDLEAYMAGHQLLIDEKYEASLPYFYKAIALNPQYSSALRALGTVQARLGNYELAESYYRKALASEGANATKNAASYTDLAFLLLLSHDPAKLAEGLACAQQAEHLESSSAEAHLLAGKALLKLNRYRDAVDELLRAEKLKPDDVRPHFLLAQAFDRLGEEQKASSERRALAQAKQQLRSSNGVAAGALPPDTE